MKVTNITLLDFQNMIEECSKALSEQKKTYQSLLGSSYCYLDDAIEKVSDIKNTLSDISSEVVLDYDCIVTIDINK